MKRWLSKGAALLVAVWLLVGLLPVSVWANPTQGDTVTISTVEDWKAFVKNCALDVWSQGKTVILTADLHLSGTEVTPVPTFGGTFEGQGHTISGLDLAGSGSKVGLFRYIQAGAVVRDLNVSGLVTPGGSRSTVGGIAGVNSGTILNCSFQGTVKGDANVGGIAGRNETCGQVSNCIVSGLIIGKSATGGVVGENRGLVLSCENRAAINTNDPDSGDNEDSSALDALDSLDLSANSEDSSSLLSDHSDVGGIAGYSSGVIQSCSNAGTVGYPHVGYNVGGIAGRQVGYLADCSNTGTIYGRKDVGGIVGQAEPDIVLTASDDILSRLRRELDTLDNLVDQALNHTDTSRSQISEQLTAIGSATDSAKDSAKVLLDQVVDFADDNLDTINSLSVAATAALDRLSPALEEFSGIAEQLQGLSDDLEQALNTLNKATDAGGEALDDLSDAVDEIQDANSEVSQAVAQMKSALSSLKKALDLREENQKQSFQDSVTALESAVTHVRAAISHIDDALEDLHDALSDAGTLSDRLGTVTDQLTDVTDAVDAISENLKNAFSLLEDAVNQLTQPGTFTFTTLGQAARDAGNDLYGSLSQMSDDMTALQSLMDEAGDTLSSDLRAISRQMNKIFDLMLDALSDVQNADSANLEDLIEDTSDENISATRQGKVATCKNTGTVEGDRNVGGIAGALSIEFDLDPEDDADTINFMGTYETKAILQGDVNRGTVIAKKDCAGGIVGDMNLGTTLDCQNYGAVSSTGGNYVGGIVGSSRATVRENYAKCTLSGNNYVGGIAGWGEHITDCAAIVTISEGTEYLGAIAGSADLESGTIARNIFVDTGLAGIDGVSYAGVAQSVDFDTLRQSNRYPVEFISFTLTLTADGKTVTSIPFQYGDDLSLLQLPDVPAKEGYYGVWPEFDTSGANSDLVLEADYIPWVTLVASGETEGKLALALAEGQFTQETALHVSDSTATPPSGDGTKETTFVWDVTLEGAELSEDAQVSVRLLNRDGGKASVWQLLNGRWTPLSVTVNGQYLLVTMTGSAGTFCIRTTQNTLPVVPILLAVGAAAVAIKKRKHQKKARV